MLHITRGTVVLYLKWTVTLQHYARNCRRLPRVLLCFCCCCDEGFALLLVPFSPVFSSTVVAAVAAADLLLLRFALIENLRDPELRFITFVSHFDAISIGKWHLCVFLEFFGL